MPLTTLDPDTALIIVDLQRGIANLAPAPALAGVVERSQALARAFRARGLPVVLVTVAGRAPGRTEHSGSSARSFPAGFTDVLPELEAQPSDILVTKRTWGAFANTGLEARLKGLGITQVVVAGVSTGTGVESSARQAYELGFNVTLATDAMMDPRPEAHAYSLGQVFPRLGETGSTDEVIALLEGAARDALA